LPAARRLTVILCCHDRPAYLERCLHGLQRQNRRDFNIIIADSASPATTANAIAGLAAAAGAQLLRLDQPGLSLARNRGLAAATAPWVAYLDDDAVPEPGWASALLDRIDHLPTDVAAVGGRILPDWEAPLPGWWPASLRGVLTIVEWAGSGFLGADLPPEVAIYGANMAFATAPLRAIGGFPEGLGRVGNRLLSGEEVEVLERLQAAGHRAFYDGAITVRHSIQGQRLRPGWLLNRLHWQGATDALRQPAAAAARRAIATAGKLLLQAPLLVWPNRSGALLRARCGAAYNSGFLRGWLAKLR